MGQLLDFVLSGEYALHRYFIWGNRLRMHFRAVGGKLPHRDRDLSPEESAAYCYASFWLGELYVVVEGWQELGLLDSTIDNLLTSPFVDRLRRYRNGVFHFQKEYFDPRLATVLDEPGEFLDWAAALNKAFSHYFLRRFAGAVGVELLDSESGEAS